MKSERSSLYSDFIHLLSAAVFLLLAGTLFLYSSSSIYALERSGSSFYILLKHLGALAVSTLFSMVLFTLSSNVWKKHAPLFFGGALLLTSLALLPKSAVQKLLHIVPSWMTSYGFSSLPSELVKIFSTVYLGFFLSRKRKESWSLFRTYIPLFILSIISGVVLCYQPQSMTAFVLALSMMIVSLSAEGHLRDLFALFITIVASVGGIVWAKRHALMKMFSFSAPWRNATVATYQGFPHLLSIGTGYWWGAGATYARHTMTQTSELYTHYMLSVIAQQVGFFGCVFILSAYMVLLFYGLRVAYALQDSFASYTTLSMVTVLVCQSAVNMIVSIGFFPVKSVALPFVSFGLAGVFSPLCMLGFIARFVWQQLQKEKERSHSFDRDMTTFSLHNEA